MLIAHAEIEGRAPLDVRLSDERIAAIGGDLEPIAGETVLDAAGGALLPGLHDHHLHLFALAAAEASVRCGPPEVCDAGQLARVLAAATADGGETAGGSEWIRGVGYHESVAGALDRALLDTLVPHRPVRIQHRSGALWALNSAAIARLGLDRRRDRPGVERDVHGRATGRLFGLDRWLREGLDPAGLPDLRAVGRRLASFGVTGVTDATPDNSSAELRAFVDAVSQGALLQRLLVMGSLALPLSHHPAVGRGAVKLRLEERDLPALDVLERWIARAHRQERAVAIHCVTRAELVLAAVAFAAAGARPGDRVEHAAVAPPAVVALLTGLPVTVVTQPGFIRERGDAYRIDVEPEELPWLYRCRGFLEASVPLGGATDAPFGDPDPWLAMQSAVDRRTVTGAQLGAEESLTPERALALFTSPLEAPGAAPRRVCVGAPADLCLLDRPWSDARRELSRALVRATVRAGAVVWRRDCR